MLVVSGWKARCRQAGKLFVVRLDSLTYDSLTYDSLTYDSLTYGPFRSIFVVPQSAFCDPVV
jgi:hypothetical protein